MYSHPGFAVYTHSYSFKGGIHEKSTFSLFLIEEIDIYQMLLVRWKNTVPSRSYRWSKVNRLPLKTNFKTYHLGWGTRYIWTHDIWTPDICTPGIAQYIKLQKRGSRCPISETKQGISTPNYIIFNIYTCASAQCYRSSIISQSRDLIFTMTETFKVSAVNRKRNE